MKQSRPVAKALALGRDVREDRGEVFYLWRAVDQKGEFLEAFVTRRRDKVAALTFLRKAMRRYGRPKTIVTDRFRSYRSAMKMIGNPTWPREVDAVARERAHGQCVVNYFRDQDAPHDGAATEHTAREGVLAEITNHLRKSWE